MGDFGFWDTLGGSGNLDFGAMRIWVLGYVGRQ